jgi:hypothetical protein
MSVLANLRSQGYLSDSQSQCGAGFPACDFPDCGRMNEDVHDQDLINRNLDQIRK